MTLLTYFLIHIICTLLCYKGVAQHAPNGEQFGWQVFLCILSAPLLVAVRIIQAVLSDDWDWN